MSVTQIILYLIAAALTVTGVIVRENLKSIKILAAQAAAIITVNLAYYIEQIAASLNPLEPAAIISLIIEASVTVIVIPQLIRKVKTHVINGNMKSESLTYTPPVLNLKTFSTISLGFNIFFLLFTSHLLYANLLPSQLQLLPLAILVLVNSVLGMVYNRDAVKITVALNMAFNAFTPLLSSLPLPYILLELTSLILVNIILVFIVSEMAEKYNTINVSEWSVNYD